MIEDISSTIAGSLIADVLHGNDPLTPDELKRAFEFVQNMEPDKQYPEEDMKLFYKFLNKFYSVKFYSADEYKEKRFISAENQFKATTLTNTPPLFVPYAEKLMSENRNFAGRIERGLMAPIMKNLAENMGLESLSDIVFQDRGFKSLPKVIDDASYNDLSGLTLYRGFRSADEIKQFISGDFFVSNWVAGSGVYFTTEKEYATAYTNSDQLVLECKLIEQDCKIIENEIIIEAMTIDTDKGNFDLFYDVGIYGAIKGFDAINRIEQGFPTKLILNRGKVCISENEMNKFLHR